MALAAGECILAACSLRCLLTFRFCPHQEVNSFLVNNWPLKQFPPTSALSPPLSLFSGSLLSLFLGICGGFCWGICWMYNWLSQQASSLGVDTSGIDNLVSIVWCVVYVSCIIVWPL